MVSSDVGQHKKTEEVRSTNPTPPEAMQAALDRLRHDREEGGMTYPAIGDKYGLNKGLVHQALAGRIAFSQEIIKKVLGLDVHIIRTYATVDADLVEPSYPPRQCPITKKWFIPRAPNQIYATGTTRSQQREYRSKRKK